MYRLIKVLNTPDSIHTRPSIISFSIEAHSQIRSAQRKSTLTSPVTLEASDTQHQAPAQAPGAWT